MTAGNMCAQSIPTHHAGVALILKVYPNNNRISSAARELLISQRRPGTAYAGYWEFPGGKIEPGESASQCAQREAAEELGITVSVLGELDIIEFEYPHAHVRLHPVVCELSPESGGPRPVEVAAWRWCAVDAIPWEEFLPANVRLITALNRWLQTAHPPE